MPEAAEIEIQIDEAAVVRGKVDGRSVRVVIRWPEARDAPALITLLAEPPPAIKEKVVPLELADGTFEVFLERYLDSSRTIIPNRRGRPLSEIARTTPKRLRSTELEKTSEYATGLIRQYRPDFDPWASREEAEFLIRTIERLSKVSEQLDGFARYLKYTGPRKRKAVAPTQDPGGDVRAAILSDVHEMGSLKIGEELRIPPGPNWAIKRENKNAGNAVKRGRRLLERYFGAEEWRSKAERMRAARPRAEQLRAERLEKWKSLGPKQQFYALLAEYRITSPAEEERAAIEDGFDRVLDDWLEAWERDDDTMERIQLSDTRFNALSLLF